VTPNTLFAVAIRLIGIWKILEALELCIGLFNVTSGASKTELLSSTSYLNHAVGAGAIGFVLLFGAPVIASMFYAPAGKLQSNPPPSP
jgi:hypothetical protein